MSDFINIYLLIITFIHVRPIINIEEDTHCIVDSRRVIRITKTAHFLENPIKIFYYQTTNMARPDLLVYSYIAVRSCKNLQTFPIRRNDISLQPQRISTEQLLCIKPNRIYTIPQYNKTSV